MLVYYRGYSSKCVGSNDWSELTHVGLRRQSSRSDTRQRGLARIRSARRGLHKQSRKQSKPRLQSHCTKTDSLQQGKGPRDCINYCCVGFLPGGLFFYRFENCGARRARLSPGFFRSLTRGSRVRNPSERSVFLRSMFFIRSALEIP